MDSSPVVEDFKKAGWLIGRGPLSLSPRRYDAWCAIADTVLVEAGATMTDLLGGRLASDVRCIRTEHRRTRAEQLFGVVPDDTTCPMVYLKTGDSDAVGLENAQRVDALLSEPAWTYQRRALARSAWRASALPSVDGAEFATMLLLAKRAGLESPIFMGI